MSNVERAVQVVKTWKGTSASAKMLAIILADFMDQGVEYPRITDIAEALGVSVVPVHRALGILKAKNMITWEHVHVEGRRWKNNKYSLLFLGKM